MFKVVLGHSEIIDSIDAVEDIIGQCTEALGGMKPIAGILLAADFHDHKVVLDAINKAFPNIELIGCTTAGEMSNIHNYCEGSLLLSLFVSDKVKIKAVCVMDATRENVITSVDKAINELGKDFSKPVLCIALTEVFTASNVMIVNELAKRFGKELLIFGGGASDDHKFTNTREFYKDQVYEKVSPMLFFSGPLKVSVGTDSGWQPFTPEKILTNSEANTGLEFEEYTPLDFYEHYLGSKFPTPAHPLAIYESGEKFFYLRAAVAPNPENGSIMFGGDIPKPEDQARVSIARATPEEALVGTERAIEKATKGGPKNPAACFVSSCTGRQHLLGTRIKEELNIIRNKLKKEIPIFGLYSYNQIGPWEKTGTTFVHNETIVTILIGEE